MAEETTRNFGTLAAQAGVQLSPTQATDLEIQELEKKHRPVTVMSMDVRSVEEKSDIWTAVIALPDGGQRIIDMWDDPRRTATNTALLQLVQDGPVSDVYITNEGRGKTPFWTFQAE